MRKRLSQGKEHPDRIGEREGIASQPRPDGTLLWFHAASVGESLSLLEVIRRLTEHDPALRFLVTTGTMTSAEILETRLPAGCIHQFVPLDVLPFVRAFLDHWKPDLAIFTESELWPALITETYARDVPLLLLNARLSERSQKRWRLLGGAASSILHRFVAVQAQDDVTAMALKRLGMPPERLLVTGTLKEGTAPPPCDEVERGRLTKLLGARAVWAAASTHPDEELAALDAQLHAQTTLPRLLLILVPRHPERGPEIAQFLADRNIHFVQRSRGEDPDSETQVLLADTLGELGLWYRLAPLSFVGGSLAEIGGHNPFEPAALGSAILHGPHVKNFRDIYHRLDIAGGARVVADADELAEAVAELMQPDRTAPMAYAAWEISSAGAEVTDKALALVLDHLPQPVAG